MDPPQCNALHSAGHYSATRKGTARRPQPSLTIPHIHTLSLSLMSSCSAAAALLFARGIPLLPLRLRRIQPSVLFLFPSLGRTSFCTATDSYEKVASSASDSTAVCSSKDPSQYFRSDHPDYRRWKDKEEEILKDIEPITFHIKQILHSTRYPKNQMKSPCFILAVGMMLF